MAKISCFCVLLGGNRRKSKDMKKVAWANGNDCPKVKPVESMEGTAAAYSGKATASDTKPVVAETRAESACQGLAADNGEKPSTESNVVDIIVRSPGSSGDNSSTDGADKEASPGTGVFPTVTPSRLERSCSNIETARPGWRKASGPGVALLAKSRSHDDLVSSTLARGRSIAASSPNGAPDASPTASTWSADRVMLRRRSSSQVLPSRSRKLWWRLFLWSHRNLHRPLGGGAATSASPRARADEVDVSRSRQRDGYTSDTLDAAKKKDKEIVAAVEEEEEERVIPSQWVAFSAEASTPLDRVSAWVSALADRSFDIEEDHEIISEIGESSASGAKAGNAQAHAQARRRAAVDEAVQASSIVQTLNGFSSVAHISGMGLKVVPMISAFSSLRAVNLSGNFIAHIAPGSLPKGLHSLDLSRNSISTTDGLRELTRLRVLSLSYNRISRIGHGLSNCTAIRELYLAGNKISDVEGLHRLLKLAVLDLSFNKITTVKGLGQLVANYNSLRALNLLGNPVQTNVGDETLRKAVSGLLPRLEYLNKQAVKPQRAREAAKDSVAKAALGNTGWSSRRRVSRRLSHSPGSSSAKNRDREGSSRSRSKNRPQSLSLTRR